MQHKQESVIDKIFDCWQCDSAFTSNSGLTYHTKANHEDIKFFCKHCDYQTKYATNLNRHQMKHENVR